MTSSRKVRGDVTSSADDPGTCEVVKSADPEEMAGVIIIGGGGFVKSASTKMGVVSNLGGGLVRSSSTNKGPVVVVVIFVDVVTALDMAGTFLLGDPRASMTPISLQKVATGSAEFGFGPATVLDLKSAATATTAGFGAAAAGRRLDRGRANVDEVVLSGALG